VDLTPLGDAAALARFADEAAALSFAAAARAAALPWVQDVVPAYRAVAVFFDADRVRLSAVLAALRTLPASPPAATVGRLHIIPCCYDLGPDLALVAERTGLGPAAVVDLHAGREYTVYAVGFCPGFPYLGYLSDPLCGVPRLPSPRVRVEPGSVGVTGRQTGIYPLPRPGGWPLIGRTPLTLVDVADGYFPLRAGDRIRFEPVPPGDYARRLGERLPEEARRSGA
jgi:inhibitor of KinA